jgi:hypothetical protein
MHQKDILAIRIGVAVESVAKKHHLAAVELLSYLKEIFPAQDLRVLEHAAAIGCAPPQS